MAKIKLITVQGYGTENNPIQGGSEKVITLKETLKPNEQIRAVAIFDFDEETDESGQTFRRGSDEVNPVVPYDFINGLVARLLKHVDAAFSDKEQRKAMRDLLMEEAWSWYHGLTSDMLMDAWRRDKYPLLNNAFDEVNEDREVK